MAPVKCGGVPVLGQICFNARRRARLTLPQAAQALKVSDRTLEAIERGAFLPDKRLMGRLVELYPVDGGFLTELRQTEAQCPQVRGYMARMRGLLEHARVLFHQNQIWQREHPVLEMLQREMEDCLEENGMQAAERRGGYFSIGHLSDNLLEALQDPEFHSRVESMAEEWTARMGQAPAQNANPAESGNSKIIDKRIV